MQQRQKRRRESKWRWGKVMASSLRDAADVEALMSSALTCKLARRTLGEPLRVKRGPASFIGA
jgi:hypothetical protein